MLNASIVVLSASLLGAGPLFACKCVASPSNASLYRKSSLIVIAKVVSVRPVPGGDAMVATLEVERSWKGEAPKQLTVVTGDNCAYVFVEGRQDVLFLEKAEHGYVTDRCAGNLEAGQANSLIKWLDRKKPR